MQGDGPPVLPNGFGQSNERLMSKHHYIACDLGAGSGRVMLGTLENGRVALEEIHRFTSEPVRIRGTFRWDILQIFNELKTGLKKIAERGIAAESVSVDSWGVDYVLFREEEPILSMPFQYRDARTDRTYAEAMEKVGAEVIFAETGIQFMSINTLYQFIADVQERPGVLAAADQFLNIADYLNYLFSGVARAEESLASTTQVYNPKTRAWSEELMRRFGIPKKIFPQIVPSGTRLGPLAPDLAGETKLAGVQVVASCSHDTGAAVAAVPAEGTDWAYLSSGTWSLIGVELPEPLMSGEARQHNFTNEAGFGGTTRFLRNIIGLWLLQECRRTWSERGNKLGYEELERAAAESEPLRSLIHPNASRFWKPDEMPEKIASYCRETGQPVPETTGQFVRCIFESLALLYREALGGLEEITGRKIEVLHIVGGGIRHLLLNQFAAKATGRRIVTGPVEATAIGNVLVQAVALGHLDSLQALRKTVRDSVPVQTYLPVTDPAWTAARERFAALKLMS